MLPSFRLYFKYYVASGLFLSQTVIFCLSIKKPAQADRLCRFYIHPIYLIRNTSPVNVNDESSVASTTILPLRTSSLFIFFAIM